MSLAARPSIVALLVSLMSPPEASGHQAVLMMLVSWVILAQPRWLGFSLVFRRQEWHLEVITLVKDGVVVRSLPHRTTVVVVVVAMVVILPPRWTMVVVVMVVVVVGAVTSPPLQDTWLLVVGCPWSAW